VFVRKLGFYLLIVNDGSDKQMLNLISFKLNALELKSQLEDILLEKQFVILIKLKFNLMKFEFHSMFFN